MENEKNINESIPVTDEEIKEVSGGASANTSLQPNKEIILPNSNKKFG